MTEISILNYYKAAFANRKDANKIFSFVTKSGEISTVIADVEKTANFGQKSAYNKNCISCIDCQLLIHNLYPIELCFYKSAVFKKTKNTRNENTYDFNNITNHKLSSNQDILNFILVDNTFYGLEKATKYGRYNIDEDIYSFMSSNNGVLLPNAPTISTIIYDKAKIKTAIENNSIDDLQKNAISVVLSSIEYNMMYEMPGHEYNDFESGNIIANTYKCKNLFDAQYDMRHNSLYKLMHTREYDRISHCNNQIFMTYLDGIAYDNSCEKSDNYDDYYKCDKVEVVNSINRYQKANGHKTNAYSIIVYSNLFSLLGKSEIAKKVSENLKDEVKHVVFDITNKLAAVNIQLLNVTIRDIQ